MIGQFGHLTTSADAIIKNLALRYSAILVLHCLRTELSKYKMASGDKTDYNALKSDLEAVIKSTVKEDVELDDDFFATVEYKVTRMTGIAGLTAEDEQKLISEDETRFENVSDEVRGAKFQIHKQLPRKKNT